VSKWLRYKEEEKVSGETNRLNDYLREQINQTVKNYLSWLRAKIEPIIVTEEDREDLIRAAYGDDVRDLQLRLYALAPDAVETSYGTSLRFRMERENETDAPIARTVTLSHGDRRPSYDLPRNNLLNPAIYPGMLEWLQACHAMDVMIAKDCNFVHTLCEQLGTYGQLLRLWPDFIQYLPGKERLEVARNQKKRSAVQAEYEFAMGKKLTRWDVQDRLHRINTRLAEGALLKSVINEQREKNQQTEEYRAELWPA